jgi:hypothetical protein
MSYYLVKEIKNNGGEIYFSSFVNYVIQNENEVIEKNNKRSIV